MKKNKKITIVIDKNEKNKEFFMLLLDKKKGPEAMRAFHLVMEPVYINLAQTWRDEK